MEILLFDKKADYAIVRNHFAVGNRLFYRKRLSPVMNRAVTGMLKRYAEKKASGFYYLLVQNVSDADAVAVRLLGASNIIVIRNGAFAEAGKGYRPHKKAHDWLRHLCLKQGLPWGSWRGLSRQMAKEITAEWEGLFVNHAQVYRVTH